MPRMAAALQTPFGTGHAEHVGTRLWLKQVLPVARVDYRGRTLDFSRSYLARLAQRFPGARVPFLLATPANEHHSDLALARGDVRSLHAHRDGLYALIETTAQGSKLLEQNPRLGVSARIVSDERGPAIEHVLGTLNPHVTGMKAWKPIELSSGTRDVLDLTAAGYCGDDLTERQEARRLVRLWENA